MVVPAAFVNGISMAGSFFHLWFAKQACATLFSSNKWEKDAVAALMAGAVGPDLGFFPGGPQHFSERIHRERCGDFLRALLAQSRSEEEMAFVAGWALHLYTDLAVHPWVEAKVRTLERERGEELKGYPGLWHMRSEWGIDCKLLERADLDYLWNVDIRFPHCRREPSLLERVGTTFYGKDASRQQVEKGVRSVERWMRRLPQLLVLCGKVSAQKRRSLFGITPFLDILTGKILGEWLVDVRSWKTAAVLAKPWWPSPRELEEVEALGRDGLRAFEQGWRERFVQFANLDLETGVPTDSQGTA